MSAPVAPAAPGSADIVLPSDRQDGPGLGAHLRFSLLAAFTAWAALLSWRGFTEVPSRVSVHLALVALVVAGVGALGRWRRLPAYAVLVLQLVVGGVATCLAAAGRPLPDAELGAALGAANDAASTFAAPVPFDADTSVQPLLVLGGFVAILAVDLCAGGLRRVPLAGLPLLTVYSVPISLLDRGLSWFVFAATAAGFLVLLFLQEEEHLSRWGRSLDGSTAPVRRLSDAVRANAIAVGSIATAAAIAVPLVVPTFSFSVFDVGAGDGGDGDIEVTNPMVDLRQDLVRGDNIELVRVRTDDPDPDHLRISVLNRYTDEQWSAGDRSVPTGNLADGVVPPVFGADPSVVEFTDAQYDVEVSDDFSSRWLPTQAPVQSVDAAGDWRYDDRTMDFLASDDDLSTAGLDYQMVAALPSYRQERLLRLDTSPAVVDDPEMTELPADLPVSIEQLARSETTAGTTDFERAVLLNQFFRSTGGFRYQLPDEPSDASGSDQLVDFLDPQTGRIGYCEQYSAAMAVMARTLGIPARVAVGFLAPSERDGDEYVYRAHDLHAWTELFFPGAGWVLFDPTPPDGVRSDPRPGYQDARVRGEEPSAAPSTSAPTVPETQAPRPDQTAPTAAPEDGEQDDPAAAGGSSFPWLTVLLVLVVVGLVVLLALAPRTLRARQRERRLAGGPESAWDELRATAVDLRLWWPEGRSPRETRDLVADWFGQPGDTADRPARGPERDPEATEALTRLADHLERSRYARHHEVEAGQLRHDVLACARALAAGSTPRTRRRAAWLPRSAFQRRRVVEPSPVEDAELVGAQSDTL
ncbi:transglutaminaseTgpA domain-containing protein [Nocardioides litoris]|uniref:transglutaminase family protein n=1 Tax=Nocardioides litoris TaxID=1926648 RepID=UPI00111E9DAB|nr:DUF3488 and transglutaminase-like domain-containing protein [Nocardioides litoris]